LPNRCL